MTYIDKKQIGRNIKAIAYDHDISLVRLAEKVGVDRSRLYNYTKGLCAPSCVTLYRIAKELGVSMDSFMDGAEVDDEE